VPFFALWEWLILASACVSLLAAAGAALGSAGGHAALCTTLRAAGDTAQRHPRVEWEWRLPIGAGGVPCEYPVEYPVGTLWVPPVITQSIWRRMGAHTQRTA
jgi:hypothetical protein